MRQVAKKYVLLAITLCSLLGNAADNPIHHTETNLVSFDKIAHGNQLFIRNSQGIILHKMDIEKSESFDRAFDLTTLPDGNYTFEVEKGLKIQITPFVISLSEVVFFKEKQTVIYKPVIRVKENTITLSRLSTNSKALVLEIYNDKNKLIISEKFENLMIVSRGFIFPKNENGDYKIIIKTEGRIFEEVVTI